MTHKLFLLAFAILFAACTPKSDKTQSTTSSDQRVPSAHAASLTDEQKIEGWKLLFDGLSLDGWRTFRNLPHNSWEVVDGTLHCKAFEDGKENLRSDLITVDQYDNFELQFDWKISAQGNSGVIYRVTEEFDQPYKSGPEYQLLDDGGYPGETKETNMTAGCYDMYAVPNKKLNKPGEWNTSKIVAKGDSIEHWLNGEKVLAYVVGSADWTQRKAASKWKDEAGYGMTKKGHIDLQDHSQEVWLKNIMIKPMVKFP
jgi:hypothetical protein